MSLHRQQIWLESPITQKEPMLFICDRCIGSSVTVLTNVAVFILNIDNVVKHRGLV